MMALWQERRTHFPDSDHPGLASIIDRRQRTEEDLIILLSADIGLFRSLTDVLESALAEAEKVGLSAGSVDVFSTLLKEKSRRELFQAVAERVADFARCEIEEINAWADQFRLERRTSVDRALVILAVPEEEWKQPEDQVYVSQILQHYAARVELQIRRGPLSRMRIGTSSSLIDAVELDPDSDLPHSIVNRVVDRSGTAVDIATRRVVEEPSFASRIRRLVNRASLFKRDTGIDG
ncbi:MAG: histidine kinase, partial [Fuerstiella sp.]|nr:histidine kinase [Fuerstiella sp.]